jgi:hypothetical protein
MNTISNTAVTTSGGKTTTKTTKTGKTIKSLCAALALASLATTVMPADAEAGWRGRRVTWDGYVVVRRVRVCD